MAKLLRVLVVILFVLSIAALVLGVVLFRQREVVKGRTQKLERGLVTIAEHLTAPKEPHIAAIDQRVDPMALRDYAAMDGQIALVDRLVEVRREQHFQEGEDHRATKGELARTKLELDNTIQELNRTQAQLERTRQDLARREAELREKEEQIRELENTVAGLRTELQQKNEELQKREEQIANLNEELDFFRRQVPAEGSADIARAVKPGLTGEVLVVNPEWNFVVLNIGSEDTLVPMVELLVHRDDSFVGKVRVRSVTEHLAIAEILRDWQTAPIREGDRVLF